MARFRKKVRTLRKWEVCPDCKTEVHYVRTCERTDGRELAHIYSCQCGASRSVTKEDLR